MDRYPILPFEAVAVSFVATALKMRAPGGLARSQENSYSLCYRAPDRWWRRRLM